MYYVAFFILMLTMLLSLGSTCWIVQKLWVQSTSHSTMVGQLICSTVISKIFIRRIEYINTFIIICLYVVSTFLFYALFTYDFSLQYVASYTDKFLPLFYRITAFWAGQAGSMLFWALVTSSVGWIFQHTSSYKNLSIETKYWFWLFYFSILTFFGFVLITWNNPFIMLNIQPIDGNGLNPLLQNPGMIFHPPLLFLGYGCFSVPSCLALAQTMSKEKKLETNWITITRPFILSAWGFLTAGIILGGWWAYMELGWGGYWAWDPVENASLIPWLISTAALHTIIIQQRRNTLNSVNVFLISLTTITAFFATYIVRSGVIQSVHAFGAGGIGLSLLIFILLFTIITLRISWIARISKENTLAHIASQEGFLIFTSWLFITLAILITLATLWPVLTSYWNQTILKNATTNVIPPMGQEHGGAIGLTSDFYNQTCLPLFTIIVTLLSLCPWLGWTTGIRNIRNFIFVVSTLCLSAVIMYILGYRMPIAILGVSSACAVIMSTMLLLIEKHTRRNISTLTAFGIHFGVALITMGIAFSGPYKIDKEPTLTEGGSVTVGNFDVTLIKINEGQQPDYTYIEGLLEVRKNGTLLGIIAPQRRMYKKWGQMQFAEADTLPSMGNEFYASLLAVDHQNNALFRLSSTPLVNWIWVGGALMSILPFLSITLYQRKKANAPSTVKCQ